MGPVPIVVRYVSGKILKGFLQDFSPTTPQFRVKRSLADAGQLVALKELKAIFFVKDLNGNSQFDERKHFLNGKLVTGKKIEVTFVDGEVLVGTTTGYEAGRPGFFLFPADEKSNNSRVFVVTAAVKNFRFL